VKKREIEMIKWDEEVQASSVEQMRYKEAILSGGSITPKEFKGSNF